MSTRRKKRSDGNSVIEFTLVGIPLIFILIATFEMARGMWSYQTLAFAVKSGARYAVVHGQNCERSPNACTVTISQIAGRIRSAGVGLPSNLVKLRFTPSKGSPITCVMSDCIGNYTSGSWPPSSANAPGQNILISGTVEFRSAMALFWPGAGRPLRGAPSINLSADSREIMEF